jgi:hypothetical protein
MFEVSFIKFDNCKFHIFIDLFLISTFKVLCESNKNYTDVNIKYKVTEKICKVNLKLLSLSRLKILLIKTLKIIFRMKIQHSKTRQFLSKTRQIINAASVVQLFSIKFNLKRINHQHQARK